MTRTGNAPDARHDRDDQPDESIESSAGTGSDPSAGQPTPEPTQVVNSSEHFAGHLRETTLSMFMYASMSPALKNVDLNAYRLFRDRLLADCGSPTDPIEIMIVEQLALAHFNTGLLQSRATNTNTIERAAVYASAAARLMAEFRRSALALQAYRLASRQLANDPAKDIILPVEQAVPIEVLPGKDHADNEQLAIKEASDGDETIIPYPGPAALGDQPAESPEVARIHAGRKGKGPRRDAGQPAVGAVHRAANS